MIYYNSYTIYPSLYPPKVFIILRINKPELVEFENVDLAKRYIDDLIFEERLKKASDGYNKKN